MKNAPIIPYIPVADVGRARKFYEEKVGLKPKEEYAGGVIYECGDGSWVFMYPSPGAGTSKASTAFWKVDDVVAEVAELKARGVAFEEYDIPGIKMGNSIVEGRWRKDCLVQRYRGQYLGCAPKGLILRFAFLTQGCWASI